ncbi:MATE family efflux transporter [Atopobacter phocae]|uniref:MATE family efflux transporter n=1 Tax=Atopobacter phocae TaxID=136492 RepID=UPI000471F994|nr:MATE family efflux transporter [Atopobacter phocae]
MSNRNESHNNPLGYRPIPKLMASLAIPAVIGNIVNAFYNIVDQIFIGQGVGYLGNAATNIAFPLVTLSLAIGLMTGLGAASRFNLELGRRNPQAAREAVGTAASMLLILGLVLCIIVRLFLEPLMIFFGATDNILTYAMQYTGITSFGLPFFLFSTGMNPLVRADRSSTYSMLAIVAGALLNTILDPLFIFYFGWGIQGAAWATVIGQIVSALILGAYLFRFKSVQFNRSDFIPSFSTFHVIVSLGMSSFIFQFSTSIIQITMNNLLKVYGAQSNLGSDIPIAVAGIVAKVNMIFIAIIIGTVQGAQPIFSYNYGAEQYERVRETMRVLLKIAMIISVIAFTLFQVFPGAIIALFGSGSEEYYAFATHYLRVFLFFTITNGIQISASTFFPSIGKAKKGALLSLTKQIFFLLPLMVMLPRFFGINCIVFSAPIADLMSVTLATTLLYFEFKKMPKENVLHPVGD